ncbi:uncharacterized protein LOC133179680 [Saccostrea echinata]|uniref:uncharacterized protein LOC133179680 n=1 Tax=Saccostrea echinata TaxID=191078 RepID=UPI002A7FFFDF|nr:uncharacterized protein LOC133179680 [Saccostrea echinata]
MKMDGRVFRLILIFCLFIVQAKAHEDEKIERNQDPLKNCTCMRSDSECKLIKNKCEDEVCSVRDAFECTSCGGGDCDCVYSVLEDRVAEICVTEGEGAEKKRSLRKFIKKIKKKIKKTFKKLKRFFRKRKNRRQRKRKNNKGGRKPKARRGKLRKRQRKPRQRKSWLRKKI